MKKTFQYFLFLTLGLALFLAGKTWIRSMANANAYFSMFLPLISKPERPMFEEIGPSSGLIVALAINPQNDQILYAGTWGDGVYKSGDGGQTWQEASTGLIDGYIQSLAIDPQTPSTIYAGMYGYGVYKSTDGATSWQSTGPGLTSRAVVYALVIDPTNPNILYAGTRDRAFTGPLWGGGAYRSNNAGETWTAINNDLDEDWVYDLAIDPQEPNLIYAALHTQGVNRSGTSGDRWYWLNSGIADPSTRALAINPLNTAEVYVGTWHGQSIFHSLDHGELWQIWNDGMYGAQIYDLEIDPQTPNVVYAGTYYRGIKKTINSGDKWLDAGLGQHFVYRIKVSPQNPQVVYAGTRGGGLFKSTDAAANWTPSDAGIHNAWVTSIIAVAPEQAVISVMGDGIFKTSDAGKSWDWAVDGLHDHFMNFVMRSPYNTQILYAGSENSGFYYSADGGTTWQQRINGLDDQIAFAQANPTSVEQPFIEDFLRDSSGERLNSDVTVTALSLTPHPSRPETLLIGTAIGLYFTDNDGIAWHKFAELSGRPISDVTYDPNNPLKILAGTAGGTSGSLLITTDGGADWNPANTGLGGATVYTIVPDPYTPDKFYVGTSTGIYVSVDGGFNWSLYGLGGQLVEAIALPSAEEVYVGTTAGLYRQLNGGEWENLHDGMRHDHIKILDLAFVAGSQTFYVATETHGVYLHNPTQP